MKPENLGSIRLSTIAAVVILALGVTLSLLAGPQAAGSGNPPLRTVADIPMPPPGPGEVLARTLACGICGSDLHALKHAEKFVELSRKNGNAFVMDLARDVVMGEVHAGHVAYAWAADHFRAGGVVGTSTNDETKPAPRR